MKFSFNGGELKDTKTEFLGVNWIVGTPVEIEREDHAAMLRRHPHFDEVFSDEPDRHSEANAFDDHAGEAEADAFTTSHADDQLASLSDEELEALTDPTAEPVRRRGRKPGSKNKPKDEA
jgi:hypothetical protein